jgi:hypothetical protein
MALESRMPRKPTFETVEKRNERLKEEALRAIDDATASDDALDAMVKRSIARHGP